MQDVPMQEVIEGILFAAGEEGVYLETLVPLFSPLDKAAVQKTLEALQASYAKGHGIELICYGGRWKFVTKEAIFPYAQKLYEKIKAPSFSSAALETLAIIAYKQPITRMEIEEIRGVSCEAVLRKLQARELITTQGRSEAIGKPLLYQITPLFLDTFGLLSLEELPVLETVKPQEKLFANHSGPLED